MPNFVVPIVRCVLCGIPTVTQYLLVCPKCGRMGCTNCVVGGMCDECFRTEMRGSKEAISEAPCVGHQRSEKKVRLSNESIQRKDS